MRHYFQDSESLCLSAGFFLFVTNPVEKKCWKAYAGPKRSDGIKAQSLPWACHFSPGTQNWLEKWEWRKILLQRAVGQEFIWFFSTFTWLKSTINSCFTEKSFHSVISCISDLDSFNNYFYMQTFPSSTSLPKALHSSDKGIIVRPSNWFFTFSLLCTYFSYKCSNFPCRAKTCIVSFLGECMCLLKYASQVSQMTHLLLFRK